MIRDDWDGGTPPCDWERRPRWGVLHCCWRSASAAVAAAWERAADAERRGEGGGGGGLRGGLMGGLGGRAWPPAGTGRTPPPEGVRGGRCAGPLDSHPQRASLPLCPLRSRGRV
eukprot:1187201-Prorocentrum_minimum.AAC.1